MRKRVFILSLIFLFTLSTTGMPLIMHYCNTMESLTLWNSIELGNGCKMHSKKINETSCCDIENDFNSTLVKQKDDCCQDFIVDNSVKDNFVSSKTESIISTELNSILSFDTNLLTNKFSKTLLIEDRAPPFLSTNKVYLSISVFLI